MQLVENIPTDMLSDDERDLDSLRDLEDEFTSITAQEPREQRFLTSQQKLWSKYFVLTGGKPTVAARAAGYKNPGKSGTKNLVNPKCMTEVKKLAVINSSAALPSAYKRIVDAIEDPETPLQVALDASFRLIDRIVGKPKASPLVQINNTVNEATAQDAIKEVWDSRSKRLSDISTGMKDIEPQCYDAEAEAVIEGAGGGQAQGPSPAGSIIPTHPSEKPEKK